MHFVLKSNKKAKTKSFVVISATPWSKKVKKNYRERGLYKRSIICVTLTNEWENYKRKYVTEVQRENSRKFNYYSEWILDEKLLKSSRVWKNDQHGKVACLQHLSIGISLAQFRWVDGELRAVDGELWAKKAREKQSEVQGFIPRSSGTSRDAFFTNLFRDKAERMISLFLKLLKNGC